MREKSCDCYAKNPRRAACKLLVIAVVLMALCAVVAALLDNPALDQLKFNLSLGSLIAVVLAINAASLAAIILLYAAYQWVRRDLKEPRSEDRPDSTE